MSKCFICHSKLLGERVRVCSNTTPHTKTPYAEKISMLLGEDLVVIITPHDHMCLKCTSNLNHLDKLHSEAKLTEKSLLSCIFKSYGILPPNESDESDEVVNGQMTTKEQPEQGQLQVPNSLSIGVAHTATTDSVVTPIPTPSKLKIQHQPPKPQPPKPQPSKPQPQQQPPKPQQQQQPPKPQQQPQQKNLSNQLRQDNNNERMKIYKCGFCTFQSKELSHVRFHMRSHKDKKIPEKPNSDQAAATTLATLATLTPITPQKRRLYRCQVCSKNFDCRTNCLEHIQKDHNPPTPSTSSGPREDSDSVKIQENNQKAETHMDVDENQEDKNSGTVDTNMMLNDNVPTEGCADVKEENASDGEETENANLGKEPDPAQEEAEAGGKDNKDEQADHKTSDGNVKNNEDDLDIESMLAAIHNSPTKSKKIKTKA